MKNKIFSHKICNYLIAFILVTSAATAHAQTNNSRQKESLPIEIQLVYMKLLKQVPNYETLISSNSALKQANETEVDPIAFLKNKKLLTDLYDHAGMNTPIYGHGKLSVTNVDATTRIPTFKPPLSDEPLVFTTETGESFGVFIRNTKTLETIQPPYVSINADELQKTIYSFPEGIPVDYVLKPIAADTKDYTTPDGKPVHVILADVIDLKVYTAKGDYLILHKNFSPIPGSKPVVTNSDHMPSMEEAGIFVPSAQTAH